MALSFLKTIEKPDDLRKIECLLSHITANKKLCKKNTIKTQTSCLHISFFIQIFCVSLHLGIKATLFCKDRQFLYLIQSPLLGILQHFKAFCTSFALRMF